MKIPGITMSPKPSIAKLVALKPLTNKSCGKTNLIGASKLFATVTCQNYLQFTVTVHIRENA